MTTTRQGLTPPFPLSTFVERGRGGEVGGRGSRQSPPHRGKLGGGEDTGCSTYLRRLKCYEAFFPVLSAPISSLLPRTPITGHRTPSSSSPPPCLTHSVQGLARLAGAYGAGRGRKRLCGGALQRGAATQDFLKNRSTVALLSLYSAGGGRRGWKSLTPVTGLLPRFPLRFAPGGATLRGSW